MAVEPVSAPLAQLADLLGVATSYEDYLQRPVEVGAPAVRLALRAMGVEVASDADAAAHLADETARRSAAVFPPSIVIRPGERVPLPAQAAAVDLLLEDGASSRVEGQQFLPDDLPLGYHRIADLSGGEQSHLIVSPGRCPLPLTDRSYGWMAQLYAARSHDSWGIGDCRDLADLAAWSGHVGAAMILVNPLHAAAPVLPQVNSPYSPTSRRYRNPIYLRIEDLPEVAGLADDDARVVSAAAERARTAGGADRIDRDAVFVAKMEALALLAAVPRSPHRDAAFREWCAGEGQGLVDFATFCVLSEEHGTPWQSWPAQLRHPDTDAVTQVRAAAEDRVDFHMWLQWLCDTQLEAAQQAATTAGMSVGIVHDLAVGVDPGGADAWALQDDLATAVTVGAPPDGFNQKGQNWALPPFLPLRLTATGYQPFRDMMRSVLRHAGGIRIDHVMGLWRLWWVPEGRSAAGGTYVRYPARDLLGVLALEAHRAGALVVGEDLGTVQAGVREALAEHRILSSRVLYFERIDDDPEQPMLPSADYPELALTSVTTHDLPTAAGWLVDEELKVQTDLDLFGESTTPDEQRRRKEGEREAMAELLRTEGMLDEDPSDEDVAIAMHAFLARTPSLLVAAGLGDALGDRRQPNMPGTTDEYPNWRLPLAAWRDGTAVPVALEDFFADKRVARIAAVLADRA